MENLSDLFQFIRLFLILLIGGTAFKACIALIQGKKVAINPLNPLNLKARWPIKNKEKEDLSNEE
tara:strand:- start:728 stop:922 length:195 start_codon:yes stop_codon:yes gene_type:complete